MSEAVFSLSLMAATGSQQVIPVLTNGCFIDGLFGAGDPAVVGLMFRFKDVQGLFADLLNSWGKQEPQ